MRIPRFNSDRRSAAAWVVLVAVATARAGGGESPAEHSAKLEFFEKRVRPLLVDNCYTCHSADTNTRGGLRVDDRHGLLLGGESGPAVVPGDPQQSLLLRAVRYVDKQLQMPPKKQLTAQQIADLTKWIADGAAWPAVESAIDLDASKEEYEELRRQHWAWQPLTDPAPPAVRDTSWSRDELDRFILAKLEAADLAPAGDADKLALVRRLTFDLTGLPPTPEEIETFVADKSSTAVETLVDRLLASPAFGERWGRHWLDVARYGESTGPSRNVPYPQAWRYRDYVIDSLNEDKPYDRFVREQIAGDLLPAESQAERDRLLVATGFLALGGKDVNQRFKNRFLMDNVDEQIDAVTRSVLALTVSCARCHDHKYDPIPTADYYALAGIFQSTELCAGVRNKMGGGGYDYYDTERLLLLGPGDQKVVSGETIARKKKELAQTQAALSRLRDDVDGIKKRGEEGQQAAVQAARDKSTALQNELRRLTDPAAARPVALGVREGKVIADTEVRIRGEAEQLGPVVPRGFLGVVRLEDAPQIGPHASGRLELSQWLTDPRNPLTSRVLVNRVWHHLFGRGIVRTVDNFGVTGDVPSHPELLDHLALRFVRDGWSVKRLVRSIVLSRTYGLSVAASPEQRSVDPANRLQGRHTPRRLEAEEIRDAVLAAAGRLRLDRPAGSPAASLPVVEVRDTDAAAAQLVAAARRSEHRSIYLPLLRGLTPTALEVFDFAQQSLVTGSRDQTTVATQALFFLNDSFVVEQARSFAERLLQRSDADDAARIEELYRRLVGRTPTAAERERALHYLADYEAAVRGRSPPTQLAAVAANSQNKKPTQVPSAQPTAPVQLAAAGTTTTDAGASKESEVPAATTAASSDRSPRNPADAADVPAEPRRAAWTSLCQAMFASAEFRYLR